MENKIENVILRSSFLLLILLILIQAAVAYGESIVLDDLTMISVKGGAIDKYCCGSPWVEYNTLGSCMLSGLPCPLQTCGPSTTNPCSGENTYTVHPGACCDCNDETKNCSLVNDTIVVTIKKMQCVYTTNEQGCILTCTCSTYDDGARNEDTQKCVANSSPSC